MNQDQLHDLYTSLRAEMLTTAPIDIIDTTEHYMLAGMQCTVALHNRETIFTAYSPEGRIIFLLNHSGLYAAKFDGETYVFVSAPTNTDTVH